MIKLLSEETIDKIAAGEVVERPASCVKELCENSIDAGSTMISVEIKDGGTSLIRVTDNGCGIDKAELKEAFLRHATSKISSIEDLNSLASLGFRGEALSSISAVSQTEVITKTKDSLTASRLLIEGANAGEISEIGAPNGTTFLIRNIFYNTPVRKKFLKSNSTEGSYIAEVMEHLALSHPEVAFTFTNGSKTALSTSGKGDLKEVIYRIYGRDITRELVAINEPSVSGYIAKPTVARSNRSFEIFFVNGRYVKSTLLSKAVEEAYKPFLMQHKFPFVVLHIDLSGADVDANVHPQKLEVRFSDNEKIYNYVRDVVSTALRERELIPELRLDDVKQPSEAAKPEAEKLPKETAKPEAEKLPSEAELKAEELPKPEPFIEQESILEPAPQIESEPRIEPAPQIAPALKNEPAPVRKEKAALPFETQRIVKESAEYETGIKQDSELAAMLSGKAEQLDLFSEKLMTKKARDEFKILGQAFETYWIMEYQQKLLFIDQHAAHEKVLYERFKKQIESAEVYLQQLLPPIIISLNNRQQEVLDQASDCFSALGFEIEEFGGKEYAIRAVPECLNTINSQELFIEILDELMLSDSKRVNSELINDRIATMSCKAAVKGNNKMSMPEIEALMDELLTLDNPYNCPHGRPTMITMSKYEMEKKFKRIV